MLAGAPLQGQVAAQPDGSAAQGLSADTAASSEPAIATWVIHFDGSLDAITLEAHSALLKSIGSRAQVLVVVSDRAQESLFLDLLDPAPRLRARLRFAHTHYGISIWARDRYVVTERRGVRTVLLPDARSVRMDRRGDLEFARRSLSLDANARLLPTQLAFEGGDLVMGREIALIGAGTIRDNQQRWRGDLDAVVDEFEYLLERRVIVLGEDQSRRPHDHADMYVHLLDDRTALVGDPLLAVKLWQAMHERAADRYQLGALGWPREEVQRDAARLYEPIVEELRSEGLRVIRVPALHADALFSWTNAVTETRAGVRHAYVPCYGLPSLDAAAHRVWRGAGFKVHPIAARAAALEGGAVRCLTNVVREPVPRTLETATEARGVLR